MFRSFVHSWRNGKSMQREFAGSASSSASVSTSRWYVALPAVLAAIATVALNTQLGAQQPDVVIAGRIADSAAFAVPGAIVHVRGTRLGAITDANGRYRIAHVPAGAETIVIHALGYAPDSVLVSLAAAGSAIRDIVLRPAAQRLSQVIVRTSPRLAETKAAALARQRNASNIVSVLSGDEIRSLPNFNAAEAAGRIPGVSLERDEGEGKFVQVRGTEPRLSNVTVDGVHVPGTEADRIPKLDDVPSDLLGAIEVSKTLSADMDADAIGGTVNLVTKTPEGPPHGYIAGQYGQIDLHSRNTYQGSLTYGGRFGEDGKLGFLLGGSADRNNRSIDDVEPAWGVYSTPSNGSVSAPNEWSLRDYLYQRERYGVGGDLDYRFDARNQVYVKGLWSLFKNYGTRWVYDISGDASPATSTSGTIAGAGLQRRSQFRTPKEQLWAGSAGGKHEIGAWTVAYAFDFAGTRQLDRNSRSSNFDYTGPDLTVGYTAADHTYPKYQYQSASDAAAAANPANYTLSNYSLSDHLTTGRDLGGAANALLQYEAGGFASQLKLGVRYRNERKDFTNEQQQFSSTGSTPLALSAVQGSFTDPSFYQQLASGYSLGPVADNSAVNAYEDAHPSLFNQTRDPVKDSLGSFAGSERVTAAYVMNTTDVGALRVNLGLRVEATNASYRGHALSTATDTAGNPIGVAVLQNVRGTRDYTDLFPSVQLRYSVNPETNVRLAVTRGIARPNYPDLAPNQSGTICSTCANQPDLSGFTTGNPDLKAQHAWNYDLLAAHYLSSVGVISGGVFYKSLSDVILTRRFTYTGPGPFNGYIGTAPENGGGGWLAGAEAAWTQRFVFLPGVLAGLGIDANYTHTNSRVLVDPESGRQAPLLRQSPNIANAYGSYDKGQFSVRLGWTYNGAMINAYGDGTPTANGDNYFYPHGQVDGSAIYNLTRATQIQFQVLNINNAVFGFYQGTPGHEFNFQREYYGQTYFLGAKLGI